MSTHAILCSSSSKVGAHRGICANNTNSTSLKSFPLVGFLKVWSFDANYLLFTSSLAACCLSCCSFSLTLCCAGELVLFNYKAGGGAVGELQGGAGLADWHKVSHVKTCHGPGKLAMKYLPASQYSLRPEVHLPPHRLLLPPPPND